jgi:hypothetical protein
MRVTTRLVREHPEAPWVAVYGVVTIVHGQMDSVMKVVVAIIVVAGLVLKYMSGLPRVNAVFMACV